METKNNNTNYIYKHCNKIIIIEKMIKSKPERFDRKIKSFSKRRHIPGRN